MISEVKLPEVKTQEIKKTHKSKTLGMNISVMALTPIYPPLHLWIRTHGDQALAAICLMNIILRFFTQDRVKLSLGRGKALLSLLFIPFLTSCTDVAEKIDPTVYYERRMSLEVDGVPEQGSVVLPPREQYKIKIKTPGDIDFLILKSCQRREIYEPKRSDFTFTFSPKALEKAIPCPLEIKALEKGKNRLTLGKIFIPTEGYDLSATLDCNGDPIRSDAGISYCEAGVGQFQLISFPKETHWDANAARCAGSVDSAGKKISFFTQKYPNVFQFQVPRGECTILFKEVGSSHFHLLYTYGVDETLPERD